MALELWITRRAAAQIEKADEWWSANRPTAPEALRNDLTGAFSLLLRQPSIGTRVANARIVGVRRLHLGRIRYHVYYRVKAGALVVLSFWHSSRSAGPSV